MFIYELPPRIATLIRAAGLALVDWSILSATHRPSSHGRGLVVALLLATCTLLWLTLMTRPGRDRGITPELYALAGLGGFLIGASPNSAASAFVFVGVVAGALRAELLAAAPIAAVGVLGLAISTLVYANSGVGMLAYALAFAAAALAASNSRQGIVRAEQAELLLAQSQRTHEEQLRSARLEESARIAREIHDVLAHTLAGLTIQLEATAALVEQDADRAEILRRVRHAHELAGAGLREARRAVGALRGEVLTAAPEALAQLAAEYEATVGAPARVTIDGEPARLRGRVGEAVVGVTREALTNVRKHAPGAEVEVVVDSGLRPGDDVLLVVEDRPTAIGAVARGREAGAPSSGLAASGGGFGVTGMRERAAELGGSVVVGPTGAGWRVELRLPALALEARRSS